MDDIEKFMAEQEAKRQDAYDIFMDTCLNKITKGDLVYRALALFIAKRFNVEIPSYCDVDGSVYHILNHYIEEVDEDFETWLNKDNGPMIRHMRELRKIFPEFDFIESDNELINTVNKIYGLELDYIEDYFFALSFDFNSFTPINVEEIHDIKRDIQTLKKYGHDTKELEEKLNDFNLDEKIIEVI